MLQTLAIRIVDPSGWRALLISLQSKASSFAEWLDQQRIDVLLLQAVRLTRDELERSSGDLGVSIDGWDTFFGIGSTAECPGVATLTRKGLAREASPLQLGPAGCCLRVVCCNFSVVNAVSSRLDDQYRAALRNIMEDEARNSAHVLAAVDALDEPLAGLVDAASSFVTDAAVLDEARKLPFRLVASAALLDAHGMPGQQLPAYDARARTSLPPHTGVFHLNIEAVGGVGLSFLASLYNARQAIKATHSTKAAQPHLLTPQGSIHAFFKTRRRPSSPADPPRMKFAPEGPRHALPARETPTSPQDLEPAPVDDPHQERDVQSEDQGGVLAPAAALQSLPAWPITPSSGAAAASAPPSEWLGPTAPLAGSKVHHPEPLPQLAPVFMLLDVVHVQRPGASDVFVLYGRSTGGPVAVQVGGYHPSFLVDTPHFLSTPGVVGPEDERLAAEALGRLLANHGCRGGDVVSIDVVHLRPLFGFCPGHTDPRPMLKVTMQRCAAIKAAVEVIENFMHKAVPVSPDACTSRAGHAELAAGPAHVAGSLCWSPERRFIYDGDLPALDRFLGDVGLSGGAWVGVTAGCALPVAHSERLSLPMTREVRVASTKALHCLSRDASSLMGLPSKRFAGCPPRTGEWDTAEERTGPPPASQPQVAAPPPPVAPLRVLAVSVVQVVTSDSPPSATCRTPLPKEDPIAVIACAMCGDWAAGPGPGADPGDREPGWECTTFAVGPGGGTAGARPLLFPSESELLVSFHTWVRAADPDVLVCFEARDSFGVIAERWKANGIQLPMNFGRSTSNKSSSISSVVIYDVEAVRRAGRMAASSNQETFQVAVEGRWTIDVLRFLLTAHSAPSYTLAASVASVLARRLEVLSPGVLRSLWARPHGPGGRNRVVSYALTLCTAALRLLRRLSVVEHDVELARLTGLNLPQVAYRGQLVRTWSLLRRAFPRGQRRLHAAAG